MEKRWTLLTKVNEPVQAELLRGLLEAQGLQVLVSQEGAAKALGLNVGVLGEIELLVLEKDEAQARQVLDDYYAGDFEDREA